MELSSLIFISIILIWLFYILLFIFFKNQNVPFLVLYCFSFRKLFLLYFIVISFHCPYFPRTIGDRVLANFSTPLLSKSNWLRIIIRQCNWAVNILKYIGSSAICNTQWMCCFEIVMNCIIQYKDKWKERKLNIVFLWTLIE